MNLLLDTHVLLWAAGAPKRLPRTVRTLIEAPDNQTFFSAASIWEVATKRNLKRMDFDVDPSPLRRYLLENDYTELVVAGNHAVAAGALPPIHKDPFDRLLVAQAQLEGLTLITADRTVAQYSGPIRRIRPKQS